MIPTLNYKQTVAIGFTIDDTAPGNGHVMIPNTVTTIKMYAFNGCKMLTSITLPEELTSIENGAFSGCSALNSIIIPNRVTSIGSSVFYACSALTSITLPEELTSIENGAFSGCSALNSIIIPNRVTSIGSSVFYACSALTSITIPDSVTSIGKDVLTGCTSLIEVFCSKEQFARIDFTNKENIMRYDSQQQKDTLPTHQLKLYNLHLEDSRRTFSSRLFANGQHSKKTPDDTNIKPELTETESDHTKVQNIKYFAEKEPKERTANVWQAIVSLFKSGEFIRIKKMGGDAFELYLPDGASFKGCKAKADKYYSAEGIIQFNTSLSSSMKKLYAQYISDFLELTPGDKFQLAKTGHDYVLIYAPEKSKNHNSLPTLKFQVA